MSQVDYLTIKYNNENIIRIYIYIYIYIHMYIYVYVYVCMSTEGYQILQRLKPAWHWLDLTAAPLDVWTRRRPS